MGKLNQVLAVEQGQKTQLNKRITGAYQLLQKVDIINGMSRTYQPFEDGQENLLPSEVKNVQVKAEDILNETLEYFEEFINITATKDWANTQANADIKLEDGTVLIPGVPVTHLLFLEKQLIDIHTIVSSLPVLDPADTWNYDDNKGWYVTTPVETVRKEKEPRVLVKLEPTDKHPGQAETYTADVPKGLWSVVKFSGAVPADKVKELRTRVEDLQKAVKVAREEANMLEVENKNIGATLVNYVLNGTV